jgi:hypothetical protein
VLAHKITTSKILEGLTLAKEYGLLLLQIKSHKNQEAKKNLKIYEASSSPQRSRALCLNAGLPKALHLCLAQKPGTQNAS